MSVLSNPFRVIFFIYLIYLYYSYVQPVSDDSTVREVAKFITEYGIHFLAFLFLGIIAQLANNKSNEFIFGVSLALITSIFIEFIHFFLPYRDFLVIEGFINIVGCLSGIYLINYFRRING